MESATVIIRNKGSRSYQLQDGPGGVKRIIEPSKTMEVNALEARQHLNYHDIEDAAQAVPQNAEMIARLTAENAALRAERGKLITPVLSKHLVTEPEKAIPPSERAGAYSVTVPATNPDIETGAMHAEPIVSEMESKSSLPGKRKPGPKRKAGR